MNPSRRRRWLSIPGLAGGLGLFLIEALIVVGLAVAAWLTALATLALV